MAMAEAVAAAAGRLARKCAALCRVSGDADAMRALELLLLRELAAEQYELLQHSQQHREAQGAAPQQEGRTRARRRREQRLRQRARAMASGGSAGGDARAGAAAADAATGCEAAQEDAAGAAAGRLGEAAGEVSDGSDAPKEDAPAPSGQALAARAAAGPAGAAAGPAVWQQQAQLPADFSQAGAMAAGQPRMEIRVKQEEQVLATRAEPRRPAADLAVPHKRQAVSAAAAVEEGGKTGQVTSAAAWAPGRFQFAAIDLTGDDNSHATTMSVSPAAGASSEARARRGSPTVAAATAGGVRRNGVRRMETAGGRALRAIQQAARKGGFQDCAVCGEPAWDGPLCGAGGARCGSQ